MRADSKVGESFLLAKISTYMVIASLQSQYSNYSHNTIGKVSITAIIVLLLCNQYSCIGQIIQFNYTFMAK